MRAWRHPTPDAWLVCAWLGASLTSCGWARSSEGPSEQAEPEAKARAGSPTSPVSQDRAEASGCGELPRVQLDPPTDAPDPETGSIGSATEGRRIQARWYDARIFAQPDTESVVIGYARRGARVRVSQGVTGRGCPADMWYALADGGYACAAREFREPSDEVSDAVQIVDAPLPYGYAKVVADKAPRFDRLPTPEELERMAAGEWVADPIEERMQGAYFVTVVETVEHGGQTWHQSDAGDFVRDEDVELLEPPAFGGEHFEGADALPLAFVQAESTPVRCDCDGAWVECGQARRMARFAVAGTVDVDGHPFVRTPDGHLVEAAAVRIAEVAPRPEEIDPDERWIRVDLSQQTLVAYEGDRPVFATMVSTGKAGHETPTGIWRVQRKYVSTTMSGPDEDAGSYTVSEVPWTLFYDGAFALHGAYWHSEFGQVRSHGCTNLPPADARWLFDFAGGVPSGWHAASHQEGPWVVVAK